MPSTVAEFRQHSRTTLTLPSGLAVLIRKCQQHDFLARGDLPILSSSERLSDTPDDARLRENIALSDLVLVRCCLSPRFVLRDSPEQDDALGVEELDPDDYAALIDGILKHSGMAREVAADLEAFRPDQERPAGGADGREIPRSAASSAAGEPSGLLSELPPGDLAGAGSNGHGLRSSPGATGGTPEPGAAAPAV